jgi:hypothetical protein
MQPDNEVRTAAVCLGQLATRWAEAASEEAWLDYIPADLWLMLHELAGMARTAGDAAGLEQIEQLIRWLKATPSHVELGELVRRVRTVSQALAADEAPVADTEDGTLSRPPFTLGNFAVLSHGARQATVIQALASRQITALKAPSQKAQLLKLVRLVRPQVILLDGGGMANPADVVDWCESLRDDPRLLFSEIWWDPGGPAGHAVGERVVRAGANGVWPAPLTVEQQVDLLSRVVDRVNQLRAAALVEPLTELSTMGYFRSRLREEMARQARRSTRLAVVAIRVRLKPGSEDGRPWPARLREYTRTIRGLVRQDDVAAIDPVGIALLLLTDIDPRTLTRRLENMGRALSRFWSEACPLGAAVFPDDADTAEDLLEIVRQRLLDALAEGHGG